MYVYVSSAFQLTLELKDELQRGMKINCKLLVATNGLHIDCISLSSVTEYIQFILGTADDAGSRFKVAIVSLKKPICMDQYQVIY